MTAETMENQQGNQNIDIKKDSFTEKTDTEVCFYITLSLTLFLEAFFARFITKTTTVFRIPAQLRRGLLCNGKCSVYNSEVFMML